MEFTHSELSSFFDVIEQVQQQLATARMLQLTELQLDRLKQVEQRVLEQRNRGRRQLRLTLVRDGLRVVVSAVMLVWALMLALVVLNEKPSKQ